MLTNTRYLVIYKDSPDDRNRYFGPFVDDVTALQFCDALPVPLRGGSKTYKPFTHYSHTEANLASSDILRSREPHRPPERLAA